MPSVSQYRAFIAVMETGAVTAAAQSVGRTQPQVSRLVAGLEAELGIELFQRHRRRLVPTPKAVRLYEETKRALEGIDNLDDVARQISREHSEVLRVFAPTYVAHSFLPEALARLAAHLPELRVAVEIVGRNSIGSWVSFHPFDIGVTTLPFDRPAITVQPFAQVETVVVLPLDHRLSRKRRVVVGDLDGERLVTLGRNTPMRQRLDGMFARAGIAPNVIVETSSSNSACELVAQGLGITVVDSIVALPRARELKLALKRWQPGLSSEFGFIYPTAAGLTKAAAEFRRVVAQVVLAASRSLVQGIE